MARKPGVVEQLADHHMTAVLDRADAIVRQMFSDLGGDYDSQPDHIREGIEAGIPAGVLALAEVLDDIHQETVEQAGLRLLK